MILVGQYDSPFVRRVAVTLNIYRLPFSRNTLSVFSDTAQMRLINPMLRIPSLILEDDTILFDSSCIIDHLDERVGNKRALMPREGEARQNILQVTATAAGTAEKAGAVVYERYFHPPDHRSKEWEQRCLDQVKGGLALLEKHATYRWFFGDRMSHADVMTGCLLAYLNLRLPEAFPKDRYPTLQAFAQRCELNAAFANARIGTNETMPS